MVASTFMDFRWLTVEQLYRCKLFNFNVKKFLLWMATSPYSFGKIMVCNSML